MARVRCPHFKAFSEQGHPSRRLALVASLNLV